MSTYWALETHGNPLGAVKSFINDVWKGSSLDGLLVHLNGGPTSTTRPRLVKDPKELRKVNPFKPLMTKNAARMIPELVKRQKDKQFGALLRPCEMRALTEMRKHGTFDTNNLLTICVDCLGTFPADEYKWRAERKKTSGSLDQETLQFARQGGILAYRYRSACQTCTSPQAQGADINICVFGLPVRQMMLVETGNNGTGRRIAFESITSGPADPILVEQHNHIVARLESNHQRTMARLRSNLAEFLPSDVDALVDQLVDCGTCQDCIDVCPICIIKRPTRDENHRYNKENVIEWLVSCAGCGMCEQACPNHLPLSTIFGHIREQLLEEYSYKTRFVSNEPPPRIH